MGILNRTPDSFYDKGAYFELDQFTRRAELLVDHGADVLDIGGVKAGPGSVVGLQEEMDRVVPAIEVVVRRVDVPVSVDTWSAAVAREAFATGAVMGNDISGFSDPEYLPVAARAGASVVATHIRLPPRVPDPEPHYDDLLGEVSVYLAERARRAEEAGIDHDRIVVDAGLDLGKTWEQSLMLLRGSRVLAGLGYPLMLSAFNKAFLGRLLGLDTPDRSDASLAACALGIARGVRIIRVHNVNAGRRASSALSAVMEAK